MPNRNYIRPYSSPILVVGPSIAYIPLTKGLFSLVDSSDIELLGAYPWHARYTTPEKIYAVRGRLGFRMHRLLVDTDLQVDHKNGNGLDNRRINLRVSNQQQNIWNKRKNKNNTSGFKGVERSGKRWIARIMFNGTRRIMGSFDTREEAHAAYCKAAIECFGEYANDGVMTLSLGQKLP